MKSPGVRFEVHEDGAEVLVEAQLRPQSIVGDTTFAVCRLTVGQRAPRCFQISMILGKCVFCLGHFLAGVLHAARKGFQQER